jgi:hypothetical protein
MKFNKKFAVVALALVLPLLAVAGGKYSYLSAKVLGEIFGNTAFSAPVNTYVGLFSTCPAAGTAGVEFNSGSQPGYTTRSAAIANGTGWTHATNGACTTSQAPFTCCTGSGTGNCNTYTNTDEYVNAGSISGSAAWTNSSGTSWSVQCFGIYDAATAGNLLYWGAVNNAPVAVTQNSTASFTAGALHVTEQ